MNMMATRAGAAAVKSVRPHSRRRVKNFPAKDALADKIHRELQHAARVSRGGKEGGRRAEKAKGKRRQISPEINLLQRQKSADWSFASILTLINCDPDACNTDYAR